MSIKDNPSDYIIYGLKFKDSKTEIEPKFKWEEDEVQNINKEQINSNIRIYYFPINHEHKNLEISFGNQKIFVQNSQNFIFDKNFTNYHLEHFSQYEKFKAYKQFVENSEELKHLLFEDCIKLFENDSINFSIFMEVLLFFKEDDNKKKMLFDQISSSKVRTIKMEELSQSEEYKTLIKSLKDEDKGQFIIKVYLNILDTSLNWEAFLKKKKDDKMKIIRSNKTIENIYIEEKLGKKKEEILNYDCKFFENYLYLMSKLEKIPQQKNIDIETLNGDNINNIIKYYKIIKINNKDFKISQNIINKYLVKFENKNNIEKIIQLLNIGDYSERFNDAINKTLENIIDNSNLSNIEICNFLKTTIISNNILNHKLYNSPLSKKFHLNKIV